ncbi:deoxyribodipyrimidine photo-lyase [Mesobacterium sp. TK19101]|uniref:Deoxyribodipyrimidine photo-lyase n=1 Tax=Mesobacterium hydrothermale TaxID=3111907 RepID=A0ABU6HJ94_9RHOB|nr:deoxyribodipyrimidine photo-lyase [Mesobacterium sp. TK19101]MEC3861910.1 deoxyribodipyrimidine photo-lyase [Mesobacterium sp. TK19101]
MVTVLWFKRDLRLGDHPALAFALEQGAPVVPLYIVEPDLWRLPDASARHYGFLCESLGSLRDDLRAKGADLVLRAGAAVEVLGRLREEVRFDHLVSHEETGNQWTYQRDKAVAAWCRGQGVPWRELSQCGVVRRLRDRDGWAAARNRFVFATPLPAPARIPTMTVRSHPIPALDLPDPAPLRQRGGRERAQQLLDSFLTDRGQSYRRAMSSPLDGAEACSRLSPHLAFGTLSVREAVAATAARQRQVRGTRTGWGGSLTSFQSRLAWRDHFIQKLEDEPEIERRNMHRAYDGLRGSDDARLQAWCRGETGLPFVDACMRSLNATGWLNFRMRAMLMSVAAYHLWLDWRGPGEHLARMFTDYEPGIHWSQVQMQSNTTGINTPRIYNPVKQGQDQDPTGVFTRRWLPELARVPDAHLQAPWRWQGAGQVLGHLYPRPIVDPSEAARHARDAIWAVRRAPGFACEAQGVVKKHASRKDSSGHFVNDRAPRRKARSLQLRFDL